MPLNDNILDAIKNRKYCLRHVEPDKQAGGGRMRDNICTYHGQIKSNQNLYFLFHRSTDTVFI